MNEEQKELLKNWKEKLIECMYGNYYCSREWLAWEYETMEKNDFSPMAEEEVIVDEFNEFIIKLIEAVRQDQKEKSARIVQEKIDFSGDTPRSGGCEGWYAQVLLDIKEKILNSKD